MNKQFILVFFILFSLSSCSESQNANTPSKVTKENNKKEIYYTCSMHPHIKRDSPGKCPICGMKLTKVEVESGEIVSKHVPSLKHKIIWYCKNFPDVTSDKKELCPIDGTPMLKKSLEKEAGAVIAQVKLRKSQLKHFRPDYFPTTSN